MKTENLLWQILDYCAEDQHRGVVTLVGPTQCGKTFQVNKWAAAKGRPVITGDIQVTDEVELGGYPLKSKDGKEVYYSLPPFITTQLRTKNITTDNFVIFLDEIDKPRFQQLVCLLSFLNPDERRLRQYVLPKNATVVCAMNEPLSSLPEPLLARMFFVPWPMNDGYFDDVPSHLIGLIKDTAPLPEIQFPHRPKAAGSSFRLNHWLKLTEFWENKPLQETVVRGLYPFESVPRVMKWLEGQQPISDPVKWIEKVRPGAIVDNLIPVLNKSTPEQQEALFKALYVRGTNDETGEIGRIWEAFVATPQASNAVGKTDAKVVTEGIEALRQAVQELAGATSDGATKTKKAKV